MPQRIRAWALAIASQSPRPIAKVVGRPVVPGRAVNVMDSRRPRRRGNRRTADARLRVAQVALGDDRHLRLEVLERSQMIRMESRLVPLAPVEGRMLPRVARERLQTARGSRARAPRPASSRAPETSSATLAAADTRGRNAAETSRIPRARANVERRLEGSARPRSATTRRTAATIASGGVSWSSIALTPSAVSAATSSSGMTPPPTTRMSSAPRSASKASTRGNTVMWAPESMLMPIASTSSWIAASTTSCGVRWSPV